jgi:hypothetical protein
MNTQHTLARINTDRTCGAARARDSTPRRFSIAAAKRARAPSRFS